ncbi:MAG: hypothetical protein AAF547_18365, partial [Actinomycetota bacterium]
MRRPVAVMTAALLAGVMVLLTGGPASAHSGNDSYVYLDVTDSTLGGRAELPIADLRDALGLELEGTDDEILAELVANRPALNAYADEHFDVGVGVADGAAEWALSFEEPELFFSDLPEDDDNYIVLPFTVDPSGEVPRTFDVRFDPFLDINDASNHLLLISNDWEAGVIDNGFD